MPASRRQFLVGSTLFLTGLGSSKSLARVSRHAPALRIGILTDIHYADKDARGTRFYRESLSKTREIVGALGAGPKLDLAVELGDLVDSAGDLVDDETIAREIRYVRTIDAEFARLPCERHYVLGNHCVSTLTKEEFAANSGAQRSWYSFDRRSSDSGAGFHFVVLDACFRADEVPYGRKNFDWIDTAIPPTELAWLEADLAAAREPVIVLAHQRLDGDEHDPTTIRNAAAVRGVLEKSDKVLAVFQGHHHQNLHGEINGIHYVVFRAVIEGSGPASSGSCTVELHHDGSMAIHGRHEQQSYDL